MEARSILFFFFFKSKNKKFFISSNFHFRLGEKIYKTRSTLVSTTIENILPFEIFPLIIYFFKPDAISGSITTLRIY